MPRVRSGGAKRWAERAAQATAEFKQGVQNPRRDWEEATLEAQDAYKEGITAALNENRFGKGVRSAGSAKQKEAALRKGEERYASGVMQAEGSYEKGIAPFLQVIESTTLPPKYKTGDPRNIKRAEVLNQALRRAKVGK
jgi:hypothetical protein